MSRAPQMKRRGSNDLTHMFINTYRLTTAFARSLLSIRSGTVADTKYSILSHSSSAVASLGLLYEVPRSLWDTPHSVSLLWTRDRPVGRWNETLTTHLITPNLHQYCQFPVASKRCPFNIPFGLRTVGSCRHSDWLRDGRSGDPIPVGGEIFRTCPDRSWGPPSLLYNGHRVFPGGKERLGCDADPSPSSSAVVKK